jgi:hypothetical protein
MLPDTPLPQLTDACHRLELFQLRLLLLVLMLFEADRSAALEAICFCLPKSPLLTFTFRALAFAACDQPITGILIMQQALCSYDIP